MLKKCAKIADQTNFVSKGIDAYTTQQELKRKLMVKDIARRVGQSFVSMNLAQPEK